MFSYYTSIIVLSWMGLGALSILIHENNRLSHKDKRMFYLTCLLIAVSALAEWCGIQVSGVPDVPRWVLQLAKCADYILTPMAGGALVFQMHLHNRWQKLLQGILAANIVFQLLAACNGWMIQIDDRNHYTHGPLYSVYMFVYIAIITLVVIQFMTYGRLFRRQNHMSLYSIMLLVVIGILMQEVLPAGHRTAYMAMTLCAILMFIHYSEYAQLATDEFLMEQQIRIDTDALTGVFSRLAYSNALNHYDTAGKLPEHFAAFTIDVNGLKTVNDRLGHDAGDELICGAAQCIEKVFRGKGRCYRTGGDEFVVLSDEMPAAQADLILQQLDAETKNWHGKKAGRLNLASGYALAGTDSGITAEELVREADKAMYAAKSEYYRKTGNDRRRDRRAGPAE